MEEEIEGLSAKPSYAITWDETDISNEEIQVSTGMFPGILLYLLRSFLTPIIGAHLPIVDVAHMAVPWLICIVSED